MGNDSRLPAICWAVIDCGIQAWAQPCRSTNPGMAGGYARREVRELRIGFELANEKGRDGRQRVLTKIYARSMWKTSTLYRHLHSWLGAELEELQRPLEGLLGRGAMLHVEPNEAGYRNIVAITPAPLIRTFDRTPLWFDLEAFEVETFHRLPEKVRDRIMQSSTFLAMHGHPTAPPDHMRPETGAELIDDEVPW